MRCSNRTRQTLEGGRVSRGRLCTSVIRRRISRGFRGLPGLLLVFLLFVPAGCGERGVPAGHVSEAVAVKTGADRVAADEFSQFEGRRVGLIANHTSAVGGRPLADLLFMAPEVQLMALFGPEHGLFGTSDAGARVADTVDLANSVPIYSLYGERRSPDPAVLETLDVLVFDIQDVGARFYTYISTMGLAMEAAAAAGIEFVVLDRPNPLGGEYVSGFVREPDFKSFVGYYPVPVAHGMTIGEIARMAVGEAWGPGLDSLRLTVIPMQGWKRSMQWPDTGLPWVPTSPNIPDFETALVYPGACFVEGTVASEGRGTLHPFLRIGAEWVDGDALARSLDAVGLAGLSFSPLAFTPRSIPEMASTPKLLDMPLSGIVYEIRRREEVRPVDAGVYLLRGLLDQFLAAEPGGTFFRAAGIDRLAGTRRLREMLEAGAPAEQVIDAWRQEVAAFEKRRSGYLMYD